MKTGFTKASGWGIAATAKRDDRRITVVINGTNSSRSRMNESSNLINWAFSQTSQKKLVDQYIDRLVFFDLFEKMPNLLNLKTHSFVI